MSQLAQVDADHLGATCLVRVSGEIDLSNAREVLDDIGSRIPAAASLIVLDLSETTYLDSTGIVMLFRLAERLHNARQELRLVVPHESPIRVAIDLTDVRDVIPVDAAVTDAVAPGPG